jgi:hypothetical protein
MPLVNILNPTTISPSSIYTTLGSGLPMSPVLTVPTGNFYNVKYALVQVNDPGYGGSTVFSLDPSGRRVLSFITTPGSKFAPMSGNLYLIEGQSLYIRPAPTNSYVEVYPTGAYVMFDIYT